MLPYKLVLLPTDLILWIMVGAIGLAIYHSTKNARGATYHAWQALRHDTVGLCASVVLFAFTTIALLDSIHIKATDHHTLSAQSSRVHSVLDHWLAPLGQATETSYSSPFASHAFSRSTRVDAQTQQVTLYYPALKHAAKLKQGQSKQQDILARLRLGLMHGCVLSLGLFLLCHLLRYTGRKKAKSQQSKSRIAIWATLFALVMVACVLLALSHNYHILGTDKVGQDIFYLSLKSIRTGLIIGAVTLAVMLPLAIILGITAGYFGGRVDDIIQYIYTTITAVPGVLLISAAVLTLQVTISQHEHWFPSLAQRADARLLALCVILGAVGWPSLCRLLRANTFKLRTMPYITAARVAGVGHTGILLRHILPNLLPLVLITAAIDFSGLVLAEAVLSYVGVGVDPSTISWGNMINAARLELARDPVVWWPLAASFIFMLLFVLSANLFADSLRDALDPHLSEQGGRANMQPGGRS